LPKKEGKTNVNRMIYDLIHHGIKGHIKRDSILNALADLSVSFF
jgi:hypothetical protein